MPLFQLAGGPLSGLDTYFSQPVDIILIDLLLKFGWIPIVLVLILGSIQVFVFRRQGEYAGAAKPVLLAIDIPKESEQSPKAMENLFAVMSGTKSTITLKEKYLLGKFHPATSFEIVSKGGYVQFFVRLADRRFIDFMESAIYAQYPDAEIAVMEEDYADQAPHEYPNDEWEMFGTEMVLSKDNHFPIRTWFDFEHMGGKELKDPLATILENLAKLRPEEQIWIQIITQQPDEQDWAKKGEKWLNDLYGVETKKKKTMISSAADAIISIPNMVLEDATGISMLPGSESSEADVWKAFKISPTQKQQADDVSRKITKIGTKVKIRWVYTAPKPYFMKGTRISMMKGAFAQFTNLNLNKFNLYGPATPKDDYFWQTWSFTKRQTKLMKAYKSRSMSVGAPAYILNTEEMATMWHFPNIEIKTPLIKKIESRRAEPPVGLPVSEEGEFALAASAPILPGLESAAELPGVESAPPAAPPSAPPVPKPVIQKAAPPEGLPVETEQAYAPQAEVPTAPEPKVENQLPDALRVLIEPGVELEDVGIKPTEPSKEE